MSIYEKNIKPAVWLAVLALIALVFSAGVAQGAKCADCPGAGKCNKKAAEQCGNCVSGNQKQAQEKFLAGLELIRKDQWPDALKQYEAAAAIESRFKKVYAKQAQLLKDTIESRKLLDKAKVTPDDVKTIKVLWNYSITRNATGPALSIADKLYKLAPSNESAELLAETYSLAAENQKAYDLLTTVKAGELSDSGKLTLGIVAARLDKKDEAAKISSEFSSDKIKPNLKYKYAVLLAASGKSVESIAVLKSILEKACPFSGKRIRAQIAKSPDFESLKSLPEFKALIETPASAPAGDSKCANCPNRGKCANSGKTEK